MKKRKMVSYRKCLQTVCLIDLLFVYSFGTYRVTMNTLLLFSYALFGLYALDQNKSHLFKIYYIFTAVLFAIDISLNIILSFLGLGALIVGGDISAGVRTSFIVLFIFIDLALRVSGIYAAYNLHKKYEGEENSSLAPPPYDSNTYINLDAGMTTIIESNKY